MRMPLLMQASSIDEGFAALNFLTLCDRRLRF
jgi:hypothetical protein